MVKYLTIFIDLCETTRVLKYKSIKKKATKKFIPSLDAEQWINAPTMTIATSYVMITDWMQWYILLGSNLFTSHTLSRPNLLVSWGNRSPSHHLQIEIMIEKRDQISRWMINYRCCDFSRSIIYPGTVNNPPVIIKPDGLMRFNVCFFALD